MGQQQNIQIIENSSYRQNCILKDNTIILFFILVIYLYCSKYT